MEPSTLSWSRRLRKTKKKKTKTKTKNKKKTKRQIEIEQLSNCLKSLNSVWKSIGEHPDATHVVGKENGEGMGIIRYIIICLHIDYYLD